MNEQYKKMMDMQDIDSNVTAQFYEKLAQKASHHKSIRWKVAIAIAIIVLMIPLSVWAAENVFGKAKVKIGEISYFPGMDGYSVRFENLENYTLGSFPKEISNLTEDKNIYTDSWNEAENAIGIDLLENAVLAEAKKATYQFYYPAKEISHCVVGLRTESDQLYYVSVEALYKYDHLMINLQSKITVEHPNLDEETKQILHGITVGFDSNNNAQISYEEYTPKEEIPVVIIRAQTNDMIHYNAVFAVNNISYEIRFAGSPEAEEIEKQILYQILDGFSLK